MPSIAGCRATTYCATGIAGTGPPEPGRPDTVGPMRSPRTPLHRRPLLIAGALLAATIVGMAPAAYGAWQSSVTVPVPAITVGTLGVPQLKPCENIGSVARVSWAPTDGATFYDVSVQVSGGTPRPLTTVQSTDPLSVDVTTDLLGGLGVTLNTILGGRVDVVVVAGVGTWTSDPAKQRITATLIPTSIRCATA